MFKLRPAERTDCEALARLNHQLGYEASPAQMQARLALFTRDPRARWTVATKDGKVVGYVAAAIRHSVTVDEGQGELVALVTDEQHRGQGIGTALLKSVEQWFAEEGISELRLTSHQRRSEAHRFYERNGWEATGLRFKKKLR
jgi:GNAT superfamily N-acetyltransferase